MKKLMVIMMVIIIAVTSFNVAPRQTVGAEEAGERVLYTSSDLGNGYGTRAILAADGKTVNYYGVELATGKQYTTPNSYLVIGDNDFAFMTSTFPARNNEKMKILENNDYRFKLEDHYGQVYLMDDTHFFTKISGDITGTADWVEKQKQYNLQYELEEEIGAYEGGMLWKTHGTVKVAKGYTTKIALMGSDKYVDMYDDDPLVTWTSSDPSIAMIDNHGVITGKSMGTVTMTAKYAENNPVSISIKVVKNEYRENITYGMNGMKVNHGDSLTHYAVTSMKWDKNGNLHCVFTKKTFKRNGKALKKTGTRKNETLYIKIYDDSENVVCRKTVKFKNVGYYSTTKKFVIKKKNLKKINFDLVHADYSMDDSVSYDVEDL